MVKILVIGHLGKDAVVNDVNGKKVINFTVASSDKFTTADGELIEKTTWIDCAQWTDKLGVVPFLKKGVQLYVEGTGDVKTYSKKDGKPGAILELRVTNVQLLGSAVKELTQ